MPYWDNYDYGVPYHDSRFGACCVFNLFTTSVAFENCTYLRNPHLRHHKTYTDISPITYSVKRIADSKEMN